MLDPTLTGEDAKLRLRFLLQKVTGTFVKKADDSLFEEVVKSPTRYNFKKILEDFGENFLVTREFRSSGTRNLVCYRADGRSPEQLKGSNPPGFGTRTITPFELLRACLLKDPDGFAEDQVRSNRPDLKSYSTNMAAGGYDSNDRYLYEVDFGQWHEFSQKVCTILANDVDLSKATKVAVDTGKSTQEVFTLFEIGLKDITKVRKPGSNHFELINWPEVVAEKPR